MSNVEAMNDTADHDTDEDSPLWHVQLPDGEVKMWSLDQLDAAFQAEIIDGETHVLQQGSSEWSKLGILLGLDEEAEAAPVAAPVAAPFVAASVAPASYAPAPQMQAPHVPTEPMSMPMYSVRPVVSDIGADFGADDLDMLRPKKKRGLVIAAVAIAMVLGGAGIAAKSFAGTAAATLPVSAANATLPVPVPTPLPAAPTAPSQASDLSGSLSGSLPPMPGGSADRFSGNQKQALLDADKARDAKHKAKMSSPSRSMTKTSSKPVFHKGGGQYDPLNSAL